MKKHLLLLFAALLPLVASAQTKVEIDGIWYNLIPKAKQAEVTFKGDSYDSYDNEYSGSITIPATVTYEGVTYSVTSIGESAFRSCSSLTSITLPEGVTSIGSSAFSACPSLTSITLPEGVTSIGSSAFSGCFSLTSITLPEGVTSIGESAFSGCRSLTSITLPEGVTSIGGRAFLGCSNLTAVYISSIEAWCKIEFGYSYSNPLSYAHNLYLNGELVTNLVIPEGVTSIGSSAFSGCHSLTSITLPEGVTSIGNRAFYNCSSLTDVYCHAAMVPSTGTNAFYNSNIENATLHVPASAMDEYKNTAPWSSFGTIKAIGKGDAVGILTIPAKPVLIQCQGGVITVSGLVDGTEVAVYTTDGTLVATATATDGTATLTTNLTAGTIAIVKTGDYSIKVAIK